MKQPNTEIPETRFLGSLSTQSIRNLLPKSISNTQTKMNSIISSKFKFSEENKPPSNPNLQIDPSPILPSDLEKSVTKTTNLPKESDRTEPEQHLMSVSSDPAVKVVVRIRPANWRERGEEWTVKKVSSSRLSVGDRTFSFDSVADSSSTQEDIFNLVGVPLVKSCLAGFNNSIISYGQTGSGKTYTMWGPPSAMVEGHLPSSNQGVVPRIFQMLFSEFQKEKENSEEKQMNYQCRCSFLEIYNEKIGDLLDPTQRNLEIRDDSKNGFYVENLSEECVSSYDDVTQILIKGLSNRKVGATSINSKSSRSHIVFTCVIESWCKGTSSKGFSSSRSSRINFVDLAGSERNKPDDDAGRQSVKEGKNVKKSLAQLGNLVHILAEKGAQTEISPNVPYKSSCLTHLLQESLGGNAKLTVICAISPHDKCKGETLSTLRFGLQAKSLQNKPVINEITEDDVNGLSDQIRQLKEELIKAKSSEYNSVNSSSGYFKGRSARESLNQLRLSINRSIILPHIDDDSEDEMDVDEEDVKKLCVQLDNVGSSCEKHSRDTFSDEECCSSFESCSTGTCLEDSVYEDTTLCGIHEEDLPFKDTGTSVASDDKSSAADHASRSSISITTCRQPLAFQEPPLSESPKIENASKKAASTLSNLSASPRPVLESSKSNVEVLRQSVKRSDHIRASLRSSMMFSSPTESLAASLHRGLQIIDSHQKNSASSSVALSFEHLARKPSQAIDKADASVQTLTEVKKHLGARETSVLCANCKQVAVEGSNEIHSFEHLARKPSQAIDKADASVQTLTEVKKHLGARETSVLCANCKQVAVEGSNEIQDSLNMWVIPVEETKKSEEMVDKIPNDEAAKRKELEKLCAEQASKIEELNQLVEQYKREKQHNADIEQSQDIRLLDNGDFTQMEEDNNKNKISRELKEHQGEVDHQCTVMCFDPSERESLLEEIQMLKNKLQSYIESSKESLSNQLNRNYIDYQSLDKTKQELEVERRKWTEKESEWICLTDELRIDLESSRRHAENVEMELRLEKKVTEELDDAIDRAVLGHARIVEHYADLQDKYDELFGRHQKIMEGIAEVKRAAMKAGKKGNNARFIKLLATELSALRVEREKEREHLKKENRVLRIQLKETAEAVHAAGELLVRLREAEEAVSVAEENYRGAQQENERMKKQLEKQKRKHAMEMVTMKQYLAESRLPESALRPMHWDEEDRVTAPTTTQPLDDDQAWRAEFGAIYQERY